MNLKVEVNKGTIKNQRRQNNQNSNEYIQYSENRLIFVAGFVVEH